MHRFIIILAAFGFLIAALHAPNPEPVKAICAVLAAVIIVSNLQEL